MTLALDPSFLDDDLEKSRGSETSDKNTGMVSPRDLNDKFWDEILPEIET